MSGQVGTVQVVGSINIVKYDGTTETVFDSVQTALSCLAFMCVRNQYYLMASDDTMITNVSNVKLLILETTFLNQKPLSSFTLSYVQGIAISQLY
jgi:hypothetical protein